MTRTNNRALANTPHNYVSVLDFGAVGDGVTDDTTAIQTALDSGIGEILIPEGIYMVTGLTINASSGVTFLTGEGNAVLRLNTDDVPLSNTEPTVLTCAKARVCVRNLQLDSATGRGDGRNTVGFSIQRVPYISTENLKLFNFSKVAVNAIQTVWAKFETTDIQSCERGFDLIPADNIGNSVVEINSAYISGATRAVYSSATVSLILRHVVMEYSGSSSTEDGALHIDVGSVTLDNCYWEHNNRNIVARDVNWVNILNYVSTPDTAADDIISFTNSPENSRGLTELTGTAVQTRFLLPNQHPGSPYDLEIGTNLTIPKDGSSANWNGTTKEFVSANLVQNTWTTVVDLGNMTTGDPTGHPFYEYKITVGQGLSGTGSDMGSVFGNNLYSRTGTTPAWLRLNGTELQVNVTAFGDANGLVCKVQLSKTILGAPQF